MCVRVCVCVCMCRQMSNEQEIQMMVLQAREAAEFMKQSIVQAVKEEGKTEYGVYTVHMNDHGSVYC